MTKKMPKNLRTLIDNESKAFWDVVNNEDDLACVLIAFSYIEKCLESLLQRCLINADESDLIIGGAQFMNKARLLLCLGQLPQPIFENLKLLSAIRNHFAHSHIGASFSDKEIVSAKANLKIPNSILGKRHGRTKFVLAAVLATQQIQVHALSVSNLGILKWCGLD